MSKDAIYFALQDTDEKERSILTLMVYGYSNSEISKELNIIKPTLEYQIKKLYKKFDVVNKRELLTLFLDDYIVKILNSPII